MRFKVDENLPVEIAQSLRESGHDAQTVPDEGLGGAEDETISARCLAEDRALVTLDLDFENIKILPASRALRDRRLARFAPR